MKYPEERVLVVRPCLKAICLNNKPAARLLSHLLYLARNCDEQEATFTVSCTQQEIIDGLIEEIDVKTLHRTAIPMLRLLGFLDVDGASYRYTYTIHVDLVAHCLLHYKNKEQLDKILIVSMQQQLDKCGIQIDKSPIELVKSPIEFDKLLIPFRQMSNSKRGRKPASHEARTGVFDAPQNSNRESKIDKITKEIVGSAHATPTPPLTHPLEAHQEEDETPKETYGTHYRPHHSSDGTAEQPVVVAAPANRSLPGAARAALETTDRPLRAADERRESAAGEVGQHDRMDSVATEHVRGGGGHDGLSGGDQTAMGRVTHAAPVGKPPKSAAGRTKPPKAAPTEDELALKARCQAIQAKINALRGFALKRTGLLIDESKVIRDHLAQEGFSDERIERIHQWLITNVWKYKSAGGRGDVGARVIWEEAGRAEAVMLPVAGHAEAELDYSTYWATITKEQFAAEFYPSEAEKRRIASYAQ